MKLGALLFTLISLAFLPPAMAQDRLLLSNGNEMQVKVLEISADSVYYTSLSDTLHPKVQAQPKTAVFFVTYQNGTKQVMPETAQAQPAGYSEEVLYAQGRTDARHYYKAGSVFWTTFAATAALPLGGPLLGIPVGAVGTIINMPKKAMIASDPEFKKSPGYLKGYQQQAKQKKLGNAAAGLGAGTVLVLGLFMALIIHH